jgi:hypothetical protein
MSAKVAEVRAMKNISSKSKRERVQYLVDLEIRLLKKYTITKDNRTMGLIKKETLDLLKDGFTNASNLVAELAKDGFSIEDIVRILKDSKNYKG